MDRGRFSRQEHEGLVYWRSRWVFEYDVRGELADDRAMVQRLFGYYVDRHQSTTQSIFVVLRRAHALPLALQLEMRKHLESKRVCVFLVCREVETLIEPLVSRCVVVRISAPSFARLLRVATHALQGAPPAAVISIVQRSRGSFHRLRGYIQHFQLFEEVAVLDREYRAAAVRLVELCRQAARDPLVRAATVERVREALNAMLFANHEQRNVLLDLWRLVSARLQLSYTLEEYLEVAQRELEFSKGKKKLIHLDAFFWGVLVPSYRSMQPAMKR